jgi:hypothetical protein
MGLENAIGFYRELIKSAKLVEYFKKEIEFSNDM